MDTINRIDHDLFLLLNGDYATWLDPFMWYASKTVTWLPVFLFLLVLLYRRYPGKKFIGIVLGVALIITISDRSSVVLFKELFHRLRPSWDPGLAGMVYSVKDGNGNYYIGGMYGFFSSHASNYAGVATFFILLMRPLNRIFILLLVLWVVLISYSRIYLGVHFPGDVLAGWIFGVLIGWGTTRWFENLVNQA